MAKKTCNCIIKHPTTPEERESVARDLAHARRIGDSTGVMLLLAQLASACPAQG